MIKEKVYKSNYFGQPRTWRKRGLIFLGIIGFVIWWEIKEDPWNFWWIKYLLFAGVSFGLWLSPVDDIMIDEAHFYHLKISLLKRNNKIIKYDFSKIKSIRCIGIHAPGVTLREMNDSRHFSKETNTVEIIFKDGTYKSIELAIYKKELLFYVSVIRERLV